MAVLGSDTPVHILENGVLERVASTTSPQPVIAIVRRRTFGLESISNAQWVVYNDLPDGRKAKQFKGEIYRI